MIRILNKQGLTASISKILFYFLGLSFLLKDQISTIAIILVAAMGLVFFLFTEPTKTTYKPLFWLCVPLLLIILHLTGFIHGMERYASKELLRTIPLLLLPMAFLFMILKCKTHEIERTIFYGVLTGLAIVFTVCNYVVITTMLEEQQSLEYFFRWRYLNFNFLKPFDAHPAYIGLFAIWAMMIALFTNYLKPTWRRVVVILLLVLLFQLVARNAMLLAFAILLFYSFKKRDTIIKIILTVIVITITAVSIFHPKDFVRNKFFHFINGEASLTEDNRFSRLEASFNIFKKAPFFGVGPGHDDVLRTQEYLALNELVAYQKQYNAHNQYVEYLSTYGLFGLLCFIAVLGWLFFQLYKTKNYLYLWLLIIFMLACSTESILVRSLGIKYFSMLIGLIFLNLLTNSNNEASVSHGRRP